MQVWGDDPRTITSWFLWWAEWLFCDHSEWDGMSVGPLERTLQWLKGDLARVAQLRTTLAIAHREVEPRSLRLSLRRQAVERLVEAA